MTRWLVICTSGVLAFCSSGCRNEPGSTTRPAGGGSDRLLKIAVIPKATNHEFWKAIHAGALKAEAELTGVQIIWKGPPREDSRNDQIAVVENFINAGVAGVVLAPLDDTALIKPVQHAMEARIPVVIMDSGLKAQAGKDFVSYVATNNHDGGRKAAGRMAEVLGGKGKILVIRYMEGSDSTTQREEGFLSEMDTKHPGIQILSRNQHTGATTELAIAKAQNLLEKYPETDAIFAPCEPAVFGILRALQEAGKAGRIKLIGFDRSDKLTEAMKNGQVHGLVLQDPINIGYLGVRTVVAHIRGDKVPERIDTGCLVATPENMTEPKVAELLHPPIESYLKE